MRNRLMALAITLALVFIATQCISQPFAGEGFYRPRVGFDTARVSHLTVPGSFLAGSGTKYFSAGGIFGTSPLITTGNVVSGVPSRGYDVGTWAMSGTWAENTTSSLFRMQTQYIGNGSKRRGWTAFGVPVHNSLGAFFGDFNFAIGSYSDSIKYVVFHSPAWYRDRDTITHKDSSFAFKATTIINTPAGSTPNPLQVDVDGITKYWFRRSSVTLGGVADSGATVTVIGGQTMSGSLRADTVVARGGIEYLDGTTAPAGVTVGTTPVSVWLIIKVGGVLYKFPAWAEGDPE